MSGLAHTEVDGGRLSEANQIMMCSTLLAAGNETTRNLLSGAAYALGSHPTQRQILIENPLLIAGAVDEFLRWVSPVISFARTAKADTTLRGHRIEVGDYVFMIYAAANRDEDVWAAANEFDVTRKPDPMHVAFGWGEHLCLGQNLARLEVKAFFEAFLAYCPTYSIVGDPIRMPSSLINNIQRMDLSVSGLPLAMVKKT